MQYLALTFEAQKIPDHYTSFSLYLDPKTEDGGQFQNGGQRVRPLGGQ